jgi:hypothetical protein
MLVDKPHLATQPLGCVLAISLALMAFAQDHQGKTTITITEVPAYDAKGGPERVDSIRGTVTGIQDCKDCRVVLFAFTNAWWVQPVADSPYTSISEGKWDSETHLGSTYAAILVRSSYKAPATLSRLPAVGGDILAVDRKPGKR